MKAYKCDICGKLFAERPILILPTRFRRLMIGVDNNGSLLSADICPDCFEEIRNIVLALSPTEENDESETSSSEC